MRHSNNKVPFFIDARLAMRVWRRRAQFNHFHKWNDGKIAFAIHPAMMLFILYTYRIIDIPIYVYNRVIKYIRIFFSLSLCLTRHPFMWSSHLCNVPGIFNIIIIIIIFFEPKCVCVRASSINWKSGRRPKLEY